MNADDLERFRLEIEEPYEKQIENLKERLQTELKRCASYKMLVAALEKERHHFFMEATKAQESRREFQSEMEANEILTNENEQLREKIDELKRELSAYVEARH